MIEYDVANTPIVDLVNQIIVYAVKQKASDIHFDPEEKYVKVRIRIDGLLKNHAKIPKEFERNIATRIKLMAGMNITENRLPQDGAIKNTIAGLDLDMRVAALPTSHGEKIVIRILDYTRSLKGLGSLGFTKKNFDKLQTMMKVPNGIILVTGATGSGKSTTVYSILQELNSEGTNIITVEDPIEMDIEGINQVQVNSEIGLDFARVLRSALREDPNIILIGEIRDSETAKIAVRASITGHLVLSTLHTNDSLTTIERLLDMDVERYLLASALTGVISQKLVRNLCTQCRQLDETTDYEKEVFRRILKVNVPKIYKPKGCSNCINGYRGRTALQEVLPINENIRDLIADENVSKEMLRNAIYKSEVTTMIQDGLEKVLMGITSFDEVYKAIAIDDELDNYVQREMLRTENEIPKINSQIKKDTEFL